MATEKKAPKGIKRIDQAAMVDPNNDHYDPENNLNTGDSPSVVIINGKPVQVRNGNIVKQIGEQKTEEEKKYENGDMGKLDLGENAKAKIVTEE